MPKYHDVEYAITTSSGTGTANTNDWLAGMVCGVEIIAPSSTTIQNVAIIDKKSVTVWQGVAKGNTFFNTKFPLRGISTISLTGATSSGANTVRILADFE